MGTRSQNRHAQAGEGLASRRLGHGLGFVAERNRPIGRRPTVLDQDRKASRRVSISVLLDAKTFPVLSLEARAIKAPPRAAGREDRITAPRSRLLRLDSVGFFQSRQASHSNTSTARGVRGSWCGEGVYCTVRECSTVRTVAYTVQSRTACIPLYSKRPSLVFHPGDFALFLKPE